MLEMAKRGQKYFTNLFSLFLCHPTFVTSCSLMVSKSKAMRIRIRIISNKVQCSHSHTLTSQGHIDACAYQSSTT